MARTQRNQFPIYKVARFWRNETSYFISAYPSAAEHFARWGWNEPTCFRCLVAAPFDVFEDDMRSWRKASFFLDKAHLHEINLGGDDEIPNTVPLCRLCHRDMTHDTQFSDRDTAIAWVAAGVDRGLFGLLVSSPDGPLVGSSGTAMERMYVKYLRATAGAAK